MYIVIPIFSDGFIHQLHEKNKLSLLYVKQLNGVGKMIQINHMDTLEKQSYDFLINSTIITTDAKKLLTIHPFKNVFDINILNWWIENKPLSQDVKNNAIDYMNNKYYNMKNVNYIIPSVKHLEWCDEVSKDIEQVWAKKDTIDFENYKQYNEEVVVAFTSIEKHGVKVVNNICDIMNS